MSQIRLLSVDFDGTLVRNWAPPPYPKQLVEVLNQLRRNGVLLAVNTGRTIRLVEEALGITGFPVRPDFALTSEREVFRWNGSRWEDFGGWNSRCRQEHDTLLVREIVDVFVAQNSLEADCVESHILYIGHVGLIGLGVPAHEHVPDVVRAADEHVRIQGPAERDL